MGCLAELIYAAGFFQAVARAVKEGQIPDQAGRFTADVYDPLHAISKDLREGFGVDSVTGRIKNDHIRHGFHFVQALQDISAQETAV